MLRIRNRSVARFSPVLSVKMKMYFRGLTAIGVLIAASAATASITTVDLTHFPDRSVVPSNTVITDQYRDIGIIFGGRQPGGQPLSLFIGGSGATGRYLFNTPDVYGAIYHFSFVDPGTTTPAFADFFSISPDFDGGESLDLVGLSDTGNDLKVVTVNELSDPSPIISISADTGTEFASVEIRTRGNPGIGFDYRHPDAFQFELAPEPASISLMLLAGVPLLRRRR